MDGDTTGMDGRHTCRGEYDHSLVRTPANVVQEGSLAGAGLSRQEDMPVRIPNELTGELVMGGFKTCGHRTER
jgi:hypothetical protein